MGLDTRVLAELELLLPPEELELLLPPANVATAWGGTVRHPPGQFGILAQAGGCALCPLAAPGVPGPPHSPAGHGWFGSSCAQGPAPAHWGLPAATRASCWGLAGPLHPQPCSPGWGCAQCCPELHPPAQHALPHQTHSHRGPVDEPVCLLLAVDDDAVALPPLLGRPAQAKAAGRHWHPARPCQHPRVLHPGGSPGCSNAGPCPHSPELLPCLHHHKVPRVVDPLVQEVVVVLGSGSSGVTP